MGGARSFSRTRRVGSTPHSRNSWENSSALDRLLVNWSAKARNRRGQTCCWVPQTSVTFLPLEDQKSHLVKQNTNQRSRPHGPTRPPAAGPSALEVTELVRQARKRLCDCACRETSLHLNLGCPWASKGEAPLAITTIKAQAPAPATQKAPARKEAWAWAGAPHPSHHGLLAGCGAKQTQPDRPRTTRCGGGVRF